MQTPSNIPYQAYRPKRHTRNISAQSQNTPSASPPPATRPPTAYSNGGINGYSQLSEPVIPLQRDFEIEKATENSEKHLLPPNGIAAKFMLDEGRRTVSMSDVVPPSETKRGTPPPVASPQTHPTQPTNAIPVPALLLPRSTSETHSETTADSQDGVVSPASSVSTRSSLPQIQSKERGEEGSSNAQSAAEHIAGPSSAGSTPQGSPGPSPRPVLSPLSASRKSTTFRHVPFRTPSARPTIPSSPLRPQSMHLRTTSGVSVSTRQLGSSTIRTPESTSRLSSPLAAPTAILPDRGPMANVPPFELSGTTPSRTLTPQSRTPDQIGLGPTPVQPRVLNPTPRTTSLTIPPQSQPRNPSPILSVSGSPTPSIPATSPVSAHSTQSTPTAQRAPTPSRTPAPYRPGFQPKGVYRPRTDEFLEMRRTRSDVGRVERTRLERRLEKLINLHFPHPDKAEDLAANTRPSPAQNRRASSFFDIDISNLKGKSAGDLWRGVVQSQVASAKNDIRAAEQTITPWEEDATVSQCPLCTSSFHPLTNRKHHCRLCGRIICSLPVKYPQRPQQCSLLFIADPITGAVEEVDQGVNYGVRQRTRSISQTNGKGKGRDDLQALSADEKFLKGVRICRDCRPVLLRRQYIQEVYKVPLFVRLYEAFIALEKEVEDALPHFQELMLTLSQDDRPVPEASAVRKRLLEAFSQYDAIAKRMRNMPCPGGPGSSQDRVQQAILNRANIFLQKHMFPLQAMPKAKKLSPSTSSPPADTVAPGHVIDPDSEVARVLQPLLEQEALLESFVEEAKVHRKFEDAQTLKANLTEIRAEIERILTNANVGNER